MLFEYILIIYSKSCWSHRLVRTCSYVQWTLS